MVETTYTATAIDGTTYTQSAGMDGATTTDNVAELAGQAAASAAAAAVAKMEWQGDWLTSTAFALNDVVYEGGSSYICIVAHTSGVFATDLAAVKWELVAQKGADGSEGDLLAANNLSDLANAGTGRTNLGLAIGSDVQAYATVLANTTASYTSAEKAKLAGVEALADVTDSTNVTAAGALMDSEVDADIKTLVLPADTTISAFGRTLVDDAAATNARTTLGLGTAATTAATDYATAAQGTLADDAAPLASPTFTGVAAAPTATVGTDTTQLATTAFVLANVGTGDLLAANNLSDLANAGTSRTNLGVAIGSDVQAYATVLANTTASYTSAEETKLSGVEALADVTDATNVTAAGALMDSELASIADVKALDQSVVSGATPTLGIANMTLDDTSLIVSDTTNLQTFVEGVDSALLRARGTGFTSTYVSTVTVGGTTFAQPAVNGEIYSDQGYFAISYAGATGITVATLSSPSTYVYVDNAGNLQQQTSIPTRQDWSRKMFTMRIAVDTSAETIIGFEYLGNPIGHYANSIRDLYRALLEQGVPFKGGQTITGRAADLGFDVAAGTLMEFGGTGNIDNANILTRDAVANVEYTLVERTESGTTGQTNLVKYWDNAGSITASGSGTFVGHRVYRFSDGTFVIQYGQGNYANLVLARAGILLENYVLNERLLNATFFGWWIIGETATNTGGTTLTEFREYTIGVQGGSSSGLAGCLLRGNNLSDLLDVSAAQVNLDLEPGVDVQAYAAVLANTTASYTTAEETKLSGIETAADVTDATNVTAAGALMDSEVTNLAAVKAFDGADYATAAQGSTADTAVQPNDSPTFGNVTVTGTVDGRDIAQAIPASLGTAAQVLTVNAGATAAEWAAAGGGGGGTALELYAENPVTPNSPSASGDNAVAIGSGANARDDNSIALGVSFSEGNNSVAIGIGATNLTYGARATGAVAIGTNASSQALQAVAIGATATATGSRSLSLGYNTASSGANANAIGTSAKSAGTHSTAVGKSYASGTDSFAAAIGNNSSSYGATGANSVAIGDLAKATATNSIAIGDGAVSTTANLIALGGTTDTVQISGVFKLPTSDGTAGQVLSTDGSGNLSWITP
jgi:hypothetical protein